MTAPALRVEGLTVTTRREALVDDLSLTVASGERVGLIGESGSGKTLTALAIMGLLPDGLRMSGTVELEGRALTELGDHDLSTVRGRTISMVFQEPMSALNPVMRIGRQVAEPLRIHTGASAESALDEAIRLLADVGIDRPELRARAYPHELSGGQRQRAMIAMALACRPVLVVADEPTTALDVTIQAQVLRVLGERIDEMGTALLLITHDLPVVDMVTDRVVVIRRGRAVESGPTRQVFRRPSDPYTAALVESLPPLSRAEPAPPPRERPESRTGPPLVRAVGLTRVHRLRRRRPGRAPEVRAVDGASFEVITGETFGIVGESGAGKTTIARILAGLDLPDSGTVSVAGIDVTGGGDLRPLRRQAQMVFQDPLGSLDPRMTVGDLIAEPLRSLAVPGDHEARIRELLEAVALPSDAFHRYPHEFSGGQRQRIAVARALAPGPSLLVADEPVSALDRPVQSVLLEMLATLKRELDLTMVFISHDLSIVHEICDRVAVLENGVIVEQGDVDQVFHDPRHPYTRALVEAIPRLHGAPAPPTS